MGDSICHVLHALCCALMGGICSSKEKKKKGYEEERQKVKTSCVGSILKDFSFLLFNSLTHGSLNYLRVFAHNWLIYVVPISAQMQLCKSGSQSYIESSGGLVKNKNCWPTPQIFDLVGLAWGLRICISSKIPGKVNAVDQGTTLGNHCCKATHLTEEGPGNLRFWPKASAWEGQSFEYQGCSLSLFMCSLSTHLSI